MNKSKYRFIYLLSLIFPIIFVSLVYLIFSFEAAWFTMLWIIIGLLMSGEIRAEYEGKKFVWAHVSDTIRDKFAFALSLSLLFSFNFLVLTNSIGFGSAIITIIVGILLSAIIFVIIATPKTRLLMLRFFNISKRSTK